MAAIRYVDDAIAQLVGALRQRGFLDNALLIVTADHGEEFGEHGLYNHGMSLYQTVIHVPLLLCLPGGRGEQILRPVQTGGIGAMILHQVGIDVPAAFTIPPLPTDRAREPSDFAYSELLETKQYQVWRHSKAVIGADAKLLVAGDGAQTAYDLNADPVEQHPLPAVDKALLATLGRFNRLLTRTGKQPGRAKIDNATMERLRGLGYFPEK